jgi:hypothetical protein
MRRSFKRALIKLTPGQVAPDINAILVDGSLQGGRDTAVVVHPIGIFDSNVLRHVRLILDRKSVFRDAR